MQTILMIVALVPVVAGFILIATLLGVNAMYMGFLFATYWGGLRMLTLPELPASFCGALTGITLAWMLHALPAGLGQAGLLLSLAAMVLSLYLLICQQAQLFLNPAFLVFLTVATIPALSEGGDYPGMIAGLALGAAYSGGLVLLIARVKDLRRSRGGPVDMPLPDPT
jgi:hypothetical protein